MSAPLVELAHALAGREVSLRILAPFRGGERFIVTVVDARDSRHKITLNGVRKPTEAEAVAAIISDLLTVHVDMTCEAEKSDLIEMQVKAGVLTKRSS